MTHQRPTLTRATRTATATAIAVIASLVVAAAAHAGAFPGQNGRIALVSPSFTEFDQNIATVNPDGTDPQFPTSTFPGTTYNFEPAYSPDGTKIAFRSNNDIWVMNADNTGTDKQQLTTSSLQDYGPAWSPDGTEIVFTRYNAGDYSIYKMNADGSGPETPLVNSSGDDANPSWSPDGTKIAFNSSRADTSNPEGDNEIYTMNPDGSGQTNVTNNSSAEDGSPNWSPNASQIVFHSDAGGNYDVYAMGADGSGLTPLTSDPALDAYPAWSPDGTKIVFASDRNSGAGLDIYTMNVNGSDQAPVASYPGDQYDPDWQPALDTYAHPLGASPSRISLVPAYEQCTSANTAHEVFVRGNNQSCKPPVRSSSISAVGPNSLGFARIVACADGSGGSPCNSLSSFPDVKLRVNITDVRAVLPGGVDYTPNPSGSDLTAKFNLRITDKRNGAGFAEAGTLEDVTFEIPMECTGTSQADPQIPNNAGSDCDANTSANALSPGIVVLGKRTMLDFGKFQVYDSGMDNVPDNADDKLLAVQGVFVP